MFVASTNSFATHLRAGNILVENVSPGGCGTDFRITILVYTKDTGSPSDVLFGGDGAVLDFGDGNTILVPYENNVLIDQTRQIAYAKFVVERYHYAGYRRYTISYREPNRNEGVLNMSNSLQTEFYLETTLTLDPSTACNKPPQLGIPPIDRGCKSVAWFHNPGAVDPDGTDSLTYAMVVPFQDRDLEVVDYKAPNDKKFYNNYNTANEAGNGPPTFKINPRDGTITWDAPGAIGEYNIAFVVIELRKIKGTWREMTRIRRDMQIIIEDCEDKRPDLIIPKDTCIEAGTTLKAEITGFDQDATPSPVKIQAFSDIFDLPPTLAPSATLTPAPDFRPSPSKVNFNWDTKCVHVRDQPYQVVFKVTEQTQQQLATFKSWFIKVVGPSPKWDDVSIVPSTRKTKLDWKSYECLNADSMQIWRRVDSVSFKPNNCQTGMPGLGYELIAQVALKNGNTQVTSYIDTNNGKGLAPGATYCYRLVAMYPKGGESYVSKDTCISTPLSNAPIITNVTVDTTDIAAGKITVKWHKPLADSTENYIYSLYRGVGFSGPRATTPIFSGTSLVFTDQGLNTKENVYNYQVIAVYNGVADSSAVASSVRLETTSEVKKIRLQWTADVPWSNQSQNFPQHTIYRGLAGSKAVFQMSEIAKVNVLDDGFIYIDSGPLDDNKDYCYIVETRGTYGNDKIKPLPLINYSQAICTQTGDTIPPCKMLPPLRSTLDYVDCNDFIFKNGCRAQSFRNVLVWNKPEDEDCRGDILGYKIYWAANAGGVYLELTEAGIVKDTVYIDSLQTSLARCYKIAAVDRSGNVGEMSDPVCIDNCPYYELPNVFTPNGDKCNDKFSAFSDRDIREEGSSTDCSIPEDDKKMRCPRFVESVVFRVYNRWGTEVYNFKGANEPEKGVDNPIYIDWNGRDKSGTELSSGVYYYIAEVTFTVVNPSERVKIFKGWVDLIR